MKDKNFINSALKVIEIESKAVKSLSNQIQSDFDDLCIKNDEVPVLDNVAEIF